ncbi:MAG: hypothetical protein Q4A05_01575 [Ruminococcus sp.]|nr:hypothetical protein [Ruminococcus sp.]
MKKIIALIAAAVLLGTMCACESKSDTSDPVGDVTAPAETEAPTEPPYLELTEADFTPVDVGMDVTDTAPPLEMHAADISDDDFGERMSPCKAPEVSEKYIDEYYPDDIDSEWVEQRKAERRARAAEPSKGRVSGTPVLLGGKCFFTVNFDDLCGCHDSSIFCRDLETGELTELVRHTGLEYSDSLGFLASAKGKLYYLADAYFDENGEEVDYSAHLYDITDFEHRTLIYSVDPESGAEEKVGELGAYVYWVEQSANGLVFCVSMNDSESNEIVEFDLATKQLRSIDKLEAINSFTYRTALCNGVPAEVTGGFDGEKYAPVTVKTQYYTVSTDLNYYSHLYVWRDKLCFTVFDDIGGNWMYTYDLKRRERLKMKFDGFSSADARLTDNGLLMAVNTGQDVAGRYRSVHRLYYILPVLGTVYRMETFDEVRFGSSETPYFVTYRSE